MNRDILTARLQEDIQSYCKKQFGPITIQFDRLVIEGSERAEVDFTVKAAGAVLAHYVGIAGYEDGRFYHRWVDLLE